MLAPICPPYEGSPKGRLLYYMLQPRCPVALGDHKFSARRGFCHASYHTQIFAKVTPNNSNNPNKPAITEKRSTAATTKEVGPIKSVNAGLGSTGAMA